MVSNYVKIPQLKKILDVEEQPCEEKIAEIRNLIDGGQSPMITGDSSLPPSIVSPTASPTVSYEKILSKIQKTNDKKTALSLLQEISKSNYLSWDPESLEIIVNGVPIKFSNIALLVKKVVTVGPATLPLAFTIFLASLVKIKAPYSLLRNGDAINVLENFDRMKAALEDTTQTTAKTDENLPLPGQNIALSETAPAESSMDTNVPAVVETATPVDNLGSRKRSREEDGEEGEEGGGKRQREEEEDDVVAKRNFDVPPDRLKQLRRSPRLKQSIADAWQEMNPSSSGDVKKPRKKRS